MTNNRNSSAPTGAFFAQSAISFGLSMLALAVAVIYLPVDPWIRAFLVVGVLYCITSAFTLAKCIRDRQEVDYLHSRVDQARVDKLLGEHDPYVGVS